MTWDYHDYVGSVATLTAWWHRHERYDLKSNLEKNCHFWAEQEILERVWIPR